MISHVLGETVNDTRPMLLSRAGASAITGSGAVLEVGGGSHATSIVNDGGAIAENLARMLTDGSFVVGSGRQYAHHQQVRLAERILECCNLEGRVFFTSGGTESFETSLRLAHHVQFLRNRPQKTQIVGHQHSYYGMSLGARLVADHPVHSRIAESCQLGWPKLPFPNADSIIQMETILDRHSETIAAVVIEPISGTTAGAIEASTQYLTALRSMCTRIGALFIADETITAFGRIGTGLASDTYRPDIVFGGKCLAASYAPISAILVAEELCEELRRDGKRIPLRLTFSGNPLACAAANAVQDYMEQNDIYSRVRDNASHIGSLLSSRAAKLPHRSWVTGRGHLWAIHCAVPDGGAGQIIARLRERSETIGVEFLGASKNLHGQESVHLMVTPALDMSVEQLTSLCDAGIGVLEHVLIQHSQERSEQ